MIEKKYKLNLMLFDEGAGAGTGETGGQASGETNTSVTEKNTGVQKVVYGKQPNTENHTQAAVEETNTTPTKTPEERRAEYQRLIQNDYKDFYTEDTQNMINRRFKDTKALEKQSKDVQTLIDVLGPRYNITDGNLENLVKAAQEDSSLFEEAAMNRGLTVEQYQHQLKLERENAEFRKATEKAAMEEEKKQFFSNLREKAAETKKLFPDFDLDKEMQNPQFQQLVLRANVDPTTAYKAVNFDNILPNAMHLAAQKQQEATVKNIQARNSRPTENGMSSQAGVVVKNDPSKLTPADIDAIHDRVRRGETISFS